MASYFTIGSANIGVTVTIGSSSAALNEVRAASSTNHWIAASRDIEPTEAANCPNSSSSSWKRMSVCCSSLLRTRSPGQPNTPSAERNRCDHSLGEAGPLPRTASASEICVAICSDAALDGVATPDGPARNSAAKAGRSNCILGRSRNQRSSRARAPASGTRQYAERSHSLTASKSPSSPPSHRSVARAWAMAEFRANGLPPSIVTRALAPWRPSQLPGSAAC